MNISKGKEKQDKNREGGKPWETLKYREQTEGCWRKVQGGWAKWVMGIKEGTCWHEHWLGVISKWGIMNFSTPETIITLYVNYLGFNFFLSCQMHSCLYKLFFATGNNLIAIWILFILRERQRARVEEGQRQRHRIQSRLQALSCQHRVRCGAELTNCGIMTWTKVRCLIDWATQAPPWLHSTWGFLLLISTQHRS